jgi:hypothetical protein
MATQTDNVWDMFDFSANDRKTRAAGRLELFVSSRLSDTPELMEKHDEIVRQLHNLEWHEKIPGFNVWNKAWNRYIPSGCQSNKGGSRKSALDNYQKFKEWARYASVTLSPHFKNNVHLNRSGKPYHRFPDFCLVVYGSGHDVEAVFPHFDGDKEYTIDDYLKSLTSDQPWKTWSVTDRLRHADYGEHGAIKAHVLANAADFFGQGWQLIQDEKRVALGPTAQGGGFIDLIFTNGEQEFLIVEAKTEAQYVDKAFGQARGYAIQFAAIAGCAPDDIGLVIASPTFYDYHHQIADEWGFRLLETPMSY